MAYLQFDGVTNEANGHRKIANLYDVKLRAIEELSAAGIDVILVVTIVNGLNDDQVGPIVEFAVENADKITVVSFQPVSFTGRDEDISDELRAAAALHAEPPRAATSRSRPASPSPYRDWFPLSALSPFGNVVDLARRARQGLGPAQLRLPPQLRHRHRRSSSTSAPGRWSLCWTSSTWRASSATSPRSSPPGAAATLDARPGDGEPAPPLPAREGAAGVRSRARCSASSSARAAPRTRARATRPRYEWRVLFVAGMWFQDLFNYDFRRTEMCIIPYGTQLGEISFCAYNTGVGWRNILEKMKANATVAEWYRDPRPPPRPRQEQASPPPLARDPSDRAGARAGGPGARCVGQAPHQALAHPGVMPTAASSVSPGRSPPRAPRRVAQP